MTDYTRRAGLGPWIQLLAEVRRLHVLSLMGQPGKALAEVQRLREHMETLPATSEELGYRPGVVGAGATARHGPRGGAEARSRGPGA